MLELNKLYNMDCMQGMKEFPDGFFDLAIVDPPYGIGIDGQKKRVCGNPKHNRKEHIRKSWDKAIPPPEYFRELERVSKAQVIWGGNYFVPYLEQGHKGWLVWDKGQHGLTMSDCELAYTSFDTPTRRQDKRSSIGVAGRSFGAGLQSRALLRLGTGGGNNYRISNRRWHT